MSQNTKTFSPKSPLRPDPGSQKVSCEPGYSRICRTMSVTTQLPYDDFLFEIKWVSCYGVTNVAIFYPVMKYSLRKGSNFPLHV